MNAIAEYSLSEKILLAASDLEDEGQTTFSAEALIVRAWQRDPRTFGLKGYAEQYPDANKVLASIMGARGLAGRGWLTKTGQKVYALSREGRQQVRRLLPEEEAPPPDAEPFRPSADLDRLLLRLTSATAFDKFRSSRKFELNFADACRFWDITEHLASADLDAALDAVRRGLNDAERLIGTGSARLVNGRTISAEDVVALCELEEHLTQRFQRHLMLLRNRAERR